MIAFISVLIKLKNSWFFLTGRKLRAQFKEKHKKILILGLLRLFGNIMDYNVII